MIYSSVQNSIFATKFSSIYVAKGQKRLVFQLSLVNLQRIARLVSHLINDFSKWMFTM